MLKFINKNKSLFALVLLPLVLAIFYFGVLATDRYVSEAKLSIKQAGSSGVGTGIMAIDALMGSSSGSREDNLHLREYILSLDMLKWLDQTIALRANYEKGGDFFSTLSPGASQEEFLGYYRNHVEVIFDDATAILSIRTQAFDSAYALRMNKAILEQAEIFINEKSHKVAREQLAFINSELERAQNELTKAKEEQLSFQNRNRMLDPIDQARAMSVIVMQLEGEKTRYEAELKQLQSYLSESAPQLLALRSKIEAVSRQINEERNKLSGSSSSLMNDKAAQYALLEFQTQFALDKYKAALAAYEKMRIESSKKLKHLVTISSPYLQEEAEYPHRLYIIATTAFVLLVAFGLFQLLYATIQDHRE